MTRWSRASRVPDRVARGASLVAATAASVELGRKRIVHDIDLEVRAGEVVALVGPNGSGKSTMLGALVRDLPLAGGTVALDGEPLGSWTSTELAMRRAVLPQHPVVTFPFTVGQIVRMGRAPWVGTAQADDDDREVADALDATDVATFRDRAFTALSGGEQARVMLARVLAQRAQLVVLDEPTASLDLHHQEVVLETARQRAAAGDGVLVVLHDLGSAAACADRVALLSEGRIVACGPPEQVLVPGVLTEVYRHDVEVLAHPVTGELLVLPRRAWSPPRADV
jgi:iron complex transport system ATP-binding protein